MADHGHGADHGHYGGHHGGDHHGHGHAGLVGGVASAGLDYAGHSHGHSGHLGHHGLGGFGNVSMSDAMTHGIAIDLAMGHGHAGHLHATHSHVAHIHGHHSHGTQSRSDLSRRVFELPGIARDATSIAVLKWPHRPCDVKKHMEAYAGRISLVRGSNNAPKNGFAPRRHDGNADVDKTLHYISSKDPFTKPDSKKNPPNLWYRDATGRTLYWRRYWQDPNQREKWRTYLVESGVTWLYGIGDAETMISYAIWSKGLVRNGMWTFYWDEIGRHRQFGERLAEEAMRFLGLQSAVDRRTVDFRKALKPEQLHLDVPLPMKLPDPMPVMPVAPSVVSGDTVLNPDGSVDKRV